MSGATPRNGNNHFLMGRNPGNRINLEISLNLYMGTAWALFSVGCVVTPQHPLLYKNGICKSSITVNRAHSFGHILTKKSEISRTFSLEKARAFKLA
jgi:hypothetical protein